MRLTILEDAEAERLAQAVRAEQQQRELAAAVAASASAAAGGAAAGGAVAAAGPAAAAADGAAAGGAAGLAEGPVPLQAAGEARQQRQHKVMLNAVMVGHQYCPYCIVEPLVLADANSTTAPPPLSLGTMHL